MSNEKIMKVQRSTLAIALSLIAVVSIGSLRGETKETPSAQRCSNIAWRMIPANCLDGGAAISRTVRMVGEDVDAFDAEANAEDQGQQADVRVPFAADFN